MHMSSAFEALLLLVVLPSLTLGAMYRTQALSQHENEGKVVTIKLKRSHPREASMRHHSLRSTLLQVSSGARAKGKKPVPSDLYGVLRVGVPPQEFTVAIDTGSGNILLPSKTCASMACKSHRAYDESMSGTSTALAFLASNASLPDDGTRDVAKIFVGTGAASGYFTTDRVCIGMSADICAKTAVIEATDMDAEPFNLVTFDGILGLGLPEASLDKRFNFLGNLAEKKALRNDRFAVWMAKPHDDKDSEMTLGGFDTQKLGSEVMWTPVRKLDGGEASGFWEVKVHDVAVNGMKMGICPSGGCRAALDTGTSVIAGPTEMINALLTELSVADDCSNYETLQKFGFHIDHFVLNIDKTDYVKRTEDSCVHQLQALDLPAPKGPIILLGDPFLRRYYTIYDRDSLQVGISLAIHNTPDGEAEDMAKVANELMVHASNS